MSAGQAGAVVPGKLAFEPAALDSASGSHMSSGSTQSPATSTTVSGRNSPWADGEQAPRHQKPMLIMNIEIGDGRTGRLEIHKGDDCDELAARFCEAHSLPAQLVLKQLSQQIARCMEQKGLLPALSGDSESSEEDDEQREPEGVSEGVRGGAGALDNTAIAAANAGAAVHSSRAWAPRDAPPRARPVHLPSASVSPVAPGPGSSPEAPRGRAAQPSPTVGSCKSGPSVAALDTHQSVPRAALSPRAELEQAANRERKNRHERLYHRGMMLIEDRRRRSEENAKPSSRSNSVGRRGSGGHERLYQRGMMLIEDRKKRIEEEQSARSHTAGKQRLGAVTGFLPGHRMRARARSAPRHREQLDDSGNQSSGHAVTPYAKSQAEHAGSAGSTRRRRASLSPADLRAKSAPRERPSRQDVSESRIPVHERLHSLACYSSDINQSARTSVSVKTPWTAAGTHWERAERQRVRCLAHRISFESGNSRVNRSTEEGERFEESVHERLFQASRVKMTELQEKEEAKKKEQEEQDRQHMRRRRLISARSEELLAESGKDSSAGCIFDKLYEEGVEKGEERQRLHEKKVKVREAEALRERDSAFVPGKKVKPFRPDIGKAARAIKRDGAWEERIDSIVEQKRQQDEANKLEAELYELSECTFCPQISKFAAEQQRHLPEGESIHDALFEQAKAWRQKQQTPLCSPLKNIKRVTKEEEKAILERLCTTPQTKDTPPARGVPDKESGSDSRVPFRPGGTLNPGWKLTPDRAKSRAKSAESCSQQRSEIEIAEKLHGYGKAMEHTKALVEEQYQNQLSIMSSTKANQSSQKLVDDARDQQLASIFSALDGDAAGYIRRKKGKLHVNLGDPVINCVIAKVLLKYFKSSVQNLTLDIFKRICTEEFKTPLSDGHFAWHRLAKLQRCGMRLSDVQEACGVEISFDGSEDEESVLQVAPAPAARQNLSDSKRTVKAKDAGSLYARLCEKNTEKLQVLEEMRRQQLQAEIEECFFYPQTNRVLVGSPPRTRPSNFYERQMEKQKQKEMYLEEERRRKEVMSLEGCTFKPDLSKSRSGGCEGLSTYPVSSRQDLSTIDLGSSFAADTIHPSLSSSAVLASVSSPQLFSRRELSTASEGGENSSSESARRFTIVGGQRSSSSTNNPKQI